MSSLLENHGLWNNAEEYDMDVKRVIMSESDGEEVKLTKENIFYISQGSNLYHLEVVHNLTLRFDLAYPQAIYCFNANDRPGIQEFIWTSIQNFSTTDTIFAQNKLLIINNIDRLDVNNIQNLDFVFPLYEKSSQIQGLIVLFTMNHPVTIIKTQSSTTCLEESAEACTPPESLIDRMSSPNTILAWKEQFADAFGHSTANFNGRAFVSRIARFAIQNPDLPSYLITPTLLPTLNETFSLCSSLTTPSYAALLTPSSPSPAAPPLIRSPLKPFKPHTPSFLASKLSQTFHHTQARMRHMTHDLTYFLLFQCTVLRVILKRWLAGLQSLWKITAAWVQKRL